MPSQENGDTSDRDISNLLSEKRNNTRPLLTWKGTDEDSECEKFKRFIEKKYQRHFNSDKEFHEWSVKNFDDYWGDVWKYFDIIASKPYKKVFSKTGLGFLDNEWFVDAEFNYAENLLRYRDDRIALMYADEEGNRDPVTYSEMFEQVRLYAAAFRKNGLEKGDRVACHISNRKEGIFAMLATLSIGAIWGGSIPYYGAQSSANIISRIDPKFLIAVDRFQDNGEEFDVLSILPTISNSAPTLEKIIIVPTQRSTLSKNISHIKQSCFLQEFLESGIQENGEIPELVFEQLPANHPVFLSFSSGTTGIAKGTIHSAWVLVHGLSTVSFYCDIKKEDVLYAHFPVGWTPIFVYISCFALGAKLYLYSGNCLYENGSENIWDIFYESKAKFLAITSTQVEKMEKLNIVPKSSLSFEFLKIIAVCSTTVKVHSIEFLYKYISRKTFIACAYGSTEMFGLATGFYLKSPGYAAETQLPILGLDVRCYNNDGLHVIDENGILVVVTPSPILPKNLWKDTDGSVVNSNYLSRFPGVWCQNDICWINPVTGGIVVKGRNDDTFKQNASRFGPGDIYSAIHTIEEIVDYICVAQKNENEERVVLFVKLKENSKFTPLLKTKIEQKIESNLSGDCVPKVILPIPDIPYSAINKKMESIVRNIIKTNKIPEGINIRNPECLKYYCNIPEIMNF